MNTSFLVRIIPAALPLALVILDNVAQASTRLGLELSLGEAIQLAEKVNPGLKAAAAREAQANANLGIAKSYLYPNFHLDAVDSFGFPGSSIPTPPQFGGLLNSPFRIGPGIGVIGRLTLFDLGNWYGVEGSRERVRLSREEVQLNKVRLSQSVLNLYFEASELRGQWEIWRNIASKIDSVTKTVKKFVKNGQYSEVQLFLIQDQADEANLKEVAFQERYQQALKRLALLIQLNEKEVSCPTPFSIERDQLISRKAPQSSPFLTWAEADLKVAQVQVSQASSEYLPKAFALGSFGALNDVRLVNQDHYSLWIGVSLSLFEGFRISSENQRAKAVVDEKENAVLESKLELDEFNIRYDEQIKVAEIELKLLERQHQAAIRTFELTKKRYLSFLEPVIHLKESIRNLARIEVQMNEVRKNLLLSVGLKTLLNGGTLN